MSDVERVRDVARWVERELSPEFVEQYQPDGVPLRALTPEFVCQGDDVMVAAVHYLGHRVVADPKALSAARLVEVADPGRIAAGDRRLWFRIRERVPGWFELPMLRRYSRLREESWELRGRLDRLTDTGLLIADGEPAAFWRLSTETEREEAALERYHSALTRGLSDHEAREDGWPSG